MLAIKLKNNRKAAVIFMLFVMLICAGVMVVSYPLFSSNMSGDIRNEVRQETLKDFSDELTDGVYFLYNQAYGQVEQSKLIDSMNMYEFLLLRKYMDYEVFDFKGKALLGENDSSKVKRLVNDETEYAFRIALVLSEAGQLQDVKADGTVLDKTTAGYQLEQQLYDWFDDEIRYGSHGEVEYSYDLIPKEVKVIFGMSEEQLDEYVDVTAGNGSEYAVSLSNNPTYLMYEWVLAVFAGVMGLLIAWNKSWRVHDWKIFRAPPEVVLIVWIYVIGCEQKIAGYVWNVINSEEAYILSSKTRFFINAAEALQILGNFVMWTVVFGTVLWGAACLQEVFVLKKSYLKERSLCAKLFHWCREGNEQYSSRMKQGAGGAVGFFQRIWRKTKGYFNKVYNEFLHMDLNQQSNKLLVKAVVVNFFLLLVITWLWFFGVFALILYSIVLYLILRKYSQDLKRKYAMLLESTNLLAEGNLDAPIDGDLGIFNPMKTEIQRIQKGFKKAVQEEVKSERMKTELITNVSHDLKTPLTAIITYIDLLKSEENPEKRKEYLEVLEKKSLRLKVLIEDLFEISKATSKNVTMNFMRVDIVGLLKQVGLECDEKIQAAHLEFRWNLPEGKRIMFLDSQKTYRIFENLIVNITKYAMPHTRVYVDLTDEENHVSISMKNVSAAELNFNTDEITDRFVRGDASRNTEGSGLGLAIAKSFTELQYGTLKISTDADLFKVVIRFPKRSENTVDA